MILMMTPLQTTSTPSITLTNSQTNMARSYRKFNKSNNSSLSELKEQTKIKDLEYDEGFRKYKISGTKRWNRSVDVDFDDNYDY